MVSLGKHCTTRIEAHGRKRCMMPHVLSEGGIIYCTVAAMWTGEWFLAAVDSDVFLEIADV